MIQKRLEALVAIAVITHKQQRQSLENISASAIRSPTRTWAKQYEPTCKPGPNTGAAISIDQQFFNRPKRPSSPLFPTASPDSNPARASTEVLPSFVRGSKWSNRIWLYSRRSQLAILPFWRTRSYIVDSSAASERIPCSTANLSKALLME